MVYFRTWYECTGCRRKFVEFHEVQTHYQNDHPAYWKLGEDDEEWCIANRMTTEVHYINESDQLFDNLSTSFSHI